MKMPQSVISLQLERSPLFVYTMASLTKVWIRYDIQDSARRSQQGLHLYSPNVCPSYFCNRSLPQPQGLSSGTAVERCCAPTTRLRLETSRLKTLTRKN